MEWAVIRRYSHRIRELYIGSSYRFTLFFLQATSLHPSLLVPNLKALWWKPCILRPQPGTSIIFIQRLLSPSLISLSVSLNDADDALRSFFANYPFLCLNLKSIAVHVVDGCEQVSRTTVKLLSQAVTHHEHLERLSMSYTPIDDVALSHIAMSSKLKTLSLVLHPDKSDLHRVRIPSSTTPLRNVEDLSLEVWDLDFVTTLLRAENQMFRSLVLCHYSRPSTEAAFRFFTALASPPRARSLHAFVFMPHIYAFEDRVAPVELDELIAPDLLSYDKLRPLSSFCHLRDLWVDIGRCISIGDDELASLAHNWSLLRSLDLKCEQGVQEYPWRMAKYITFKGLLSLLQCCPELHHLSLPLDAREVPIDIGDVVHNPALTSIHFPDSPISNSDLVTDVLTRHFPCVTKVAASFYTRSGEEDAELELYTSSWHGVNMHLQNIHFPVQDG